MTNRERRVTWLGGACAIGLVALLGRADAPAGRYTIADGTVYDTKTKLTWQQAIAPSTSAWSGASQYCGSLTLGGMSWRLPGARELQTIVDESRVSPAVDSIAFSGTPAGPASVFWTSSAGRDTTNMAWAVSFEKGEVNLVPATSSLLVRCVR